MLHAGNSIPLVTKSTPMSDTLLINDQKGSAWLASGTPMATLNVLSFITDGDLRRHMTGLLDMTARHLMTGNPSTVAPGTLAADVIGVMEGKITCLFGVGEDAREQGILHISDCLRAGVV